MQFILVNIAVIVAIDHFEYFFDIFLLFYSFLVHKTRNKIRIVQHAVLICLNEVQKIFNFFICFVFRRKPRSQLVNWQKTILIRIKLFEKPLVTPELFLWHLSGEICCCYLLKPWKFGVTGNQGEVNCHFGFLRSNSHPRMMKNLFNCDSFIDGC